MDGDGGDREMGHQIDTDCSKIITNDLVEEMELNVSEAEADEDDLTKERVLKCHVILDAIFKYSSFGDLKNFRHVCHVWNDVCLKEILQRPQKPIKINSCEHLETDNKLWELIQLQQQHKNLFNIDHQLFPSFTINASLLVLTQLGSLIEYFAPKFVEFYNYEKTTIVEMPNGLHKEVDTEEESEPEILQYFSEFLIRISPTIQEIQFDDLYFDFNENVTFEIDQNLSTTSFSKLKKIVINMKQKNQIVTKLLEPLIQNSPILDHLRIGSHSDKHAPIDFGPQDEIRELFNATGLMHKLKILELINIDLCLLKVVGEYAGNGLLELDELNFETFNVLNCYNYNSCFVRLVSTQANSLKILKMSIPLWHNISKKRKQFPTLKNLKFLQIYSSAYFEKFYKPINFAQQFPKLEEFRSDDLKRLLYKKLVLGGGSIKTIKLHVHHKNGVFINDPSIPFEIEWGDFDKIFPNLEFLEMNLDCLPLFQDPPNLKNLPFWLKLKKVVITDCTFLNIAPFGGQLLKLEVLNKLEIIVDCKDWNLRDPDTYMVDIGSIIEGKYDSISDDHDKLHLYTKFLNMLSSSFNPIQHILLIKFRGYKICENFKRDIRTIFDRTEFVSTPFFNTQD